MIEEATFLGVPLRTLRNRRLLVAGYYAVVLLLTLLGLRFPRYLTTLLITQSFILSSLLGGIRIGGPVKFWGDKRSPRSESLPDGSGIQQLNLAGRPRRSLFTPLDERDRLERDRAHYRAYNILRITLPLAALFVLTAIDFFPHWLQDHSLILTWTVMIFTLSLPQAIILCTEPEPSGELTLLDA